MITLKLPVQIQSSHVLPFVAALDVPGEEIHLDFGQVRRISPSGLVALVANVKRWQREHRKVEFVNLDQCAILGYLQRMNLLTVCGADLPENFKRNESRGRFVPVQLIDRDVEQMGDELASCLAPGGEDYDHPHSSLYELAWYVFTELANNARQHSQGLGCAAAQITRSEGLVKLALADNGRGIRQSFVDAGLAWAEKLTDSEAILKALDSKISSKGNPTNEGVGLTLVAQLVRQTNGWLAVVSQSGLLTIKPGEEPEIGTLPEGASFHGTMVVAVFRQESVVDFANLLHDAKVQKGLLHAGNVSGSFG